MRILDAILLALLVVGNVLALPIWWWLFVTPLFHHLIKPRLGIRRPPN